MLRTLGEAYKVGQLQSYRLRASEAFYHATLGGFYHQRQRRRQSISAGSSPVARAL
ncbi:Guanine deaminase [Klebsiella pneumoniae subsp. pneumoniae ST512-K30BO]|nr:Guanine deaminase [Klebsiella pneumoniae subsp. pneumoniae ST512-K30BO]